MTYLHTSQVMAELVRSAKSGSDWTPNELAAYNITADSDTCDVHHNWER